MRLTLVLLTAILATPLAVQAQVNAAPPRILADEAGESAELAASLCGAPAADIVEYKRRVDLFEPGTTQSRDYLDGVARIQLAMQQLRASGDDMHEFRDTRCDMAMNRINRVLAARTP